MPVNRNDFFSHSFNFLPKVKILDWSKLKAFTGNKVYVTQKLKFVLEG